MSSIQPQYLVLNAPAAADVTYGSTTSGFMTLGQGANSSSPIKVLNITSAPSQGYVAETLQVTTLTPATFAAGNVYQFTIGQMINGVVNTVNVEYTAVASDLNVTAVCDALRSIVTTLAAVGQIQVTPSGGATLILTAKTGNPVFVASTISNLTAVTGTPGVAAIGKGSNLLAQGFQSISEIPVAATNYDLVIINYTNEVNDLNTIARTQVAQLFVYFNEAAGADLTAFRAALNTALFPALLADSVAQLKKVPAAVA
jgi:hypothetical protein